MQHPQGNIIEKVEYWILFGIMNSLRNIYPKNVQDSENVFGTQWINLFGTI